VSHPGLTLRGPGVGARRHLVDPWQQVGVGRGPALRHEPRLPDAVRPPDQLVRESARLARAERSNSQLTKATAPGRRPTSPRRQI
jgi:hypothetical protein